jgi:hypothetical protein
VHFLLAAALSAALLQTPGPCEQGSSLFRAKSCSEAQEFLWKCVLAGTPDKERASELGGSHLRWVPATATLVHHRHRQRGKFFCGRGKVSGGTAKITVISVAGIRCRTRETRY